MSHRTSHYRLIIIILFTALQTHATTFVTRNQKPETSNKLNPLIEITYAATNKKPAPVTRAEAVMELLLSRTSRVPDVRSDGRFPDVKPTDWFDRYVTMAERYHIISADPATGRIHPNDPINRAEFLKMIASTFGLPHFTPYLFTDVSPLSWHAEFAGLAERYDLFPESTKSRRLESSHLLTHSEVALAIRKIQGQTIENAAPEGGEDNPGNQAGLKLNLYLIMSTTKDTETFVRPPEPTHIITAPTPPPPPPPAATPNIPLLKAAVVSLVNAERAKRSLPLLATNVFLELSAGRYASAMAEQGFFGHRSPAGETLRERISRSGYYTAFFTAPCTCARTFHLAENLARGQKTPTEVMDAWMKSPAHRAAILSPDYHDIGVGLNAGVWVEHFGGLQKPSQTLSPPPAHPPSRSSRPGQQLHG